MSKKFFAALLSLSFIQTICLSQSPTGVNNVAPRIRVIMDNDFGGDPDGLFALAHLLLSPSLDVRAIIGCHLRAGDGFDRSTEQAENAAKKASELRALIQTASNVPIIAGSNVAMLNDSTPVKNRAVSFIINEASRTDTQLPLYVVCGAGLTEIASALLTDPSIANKLTVIWIGGLEYPDLALPPPHYSKIEYNTNIDIAAVKAVFNRSTVPIWQVPRNAYRQAIFPYSQLLLQVKPKGKVGNYLCTQIENVMKAAHNWKLDLGEVYILGDSPLVLLTALQSSFEADPSSSEYVIKMAPMINNEGGYDLNSKGRNIRVYTRLDIKLMFDDFLAKLELMTK
jgi:inosine-uridine nucleoside N-ribohydrolase